MSKAAVRSSKHILNGPFGLALPAYSDFDFIVFFILLSLCMFVFFVLLFFVVFVLPSSVIKNDD